MLFFLFQKRSIQIVYTHDDPFYLACGNVNNIIKSSELSAEHSFKCFANNQMKGTTDIYNLGLGSGESDQIKIRN